MGYFLPFYPFNSEKKIRILKKWKKSLEISSFYISVSKLMIKWCTVSEIWCVADVMISHFGLFFALLSPNSPKNQNFEKLKRSLEISFYISVPKIMIRQCTVLEICCATDGWMGRWTEGWTDRWKKWHIEVGGPPKNQLKPTNVQVQFFSTTTGI